MPWVAGHLTGGLGNRLFQHAAAAGLAEREGHDLVFYVPQCSETNHGAFDTVFKLFPTVPQIRTNAEHQMLREPPNGVFTYFPFPPLSLSTNYCIDGWRQSENYFPSQGIHPDFSNCLSATNQLSLLQQFGLDTLENQRNTWFLHIRLGDYKILPHHQINIESYILKAIQYVPKDSRILVFSDEAAVYKPVFLQFFARMGRTVEIVDIPDEVEALFSMSHCLGGAIVANSTFSWWGAYLAHQRHPNPSEYKAIYPANWGKGLPAATDVVPSWGIKLASD
jgi:hypothetical protein